jgi:hypothetical protein
MARDSNADPHAIFSFILSLIHVWMKGPFSDQTHLGLLLLDQRLDLLALCLSHTHQVPVLSLSKFVDRIEYSLRPVL